MAVDSEGAVKTLCVAESPDVFGIPLGELARDGTLVVKTTAPGAIDRLDATDIDCVLIAATGAAPDVLSVIGRVREANPDLPIVVLANPDSVRKSRALTAGATRVVRPGEEEPEELLTRLRSVLMTVAPAEGRTPGSEDHPLGWGEPGSSRLMRRALEEAPVGITIADTRKPDDPLIYVNEGFERETGYSVSEAIGQNCRFLQGEDTDPEAIRAISTAIDDGEPASVELLNYRKDGEPFWNRLDLAPLRNDAGEVTHYVGFQTDVTDRKEAEAMAKRRAAEIKEERQSLEHLLDRVDGLLQDVTSAVVETAGADAIKAAVCDRLGATDGYLFAWIGSPDLGTETVSPSHWGGVETDPATLEALTVDLGAESDHPSARALEDHSVVTTTDPDAFVDPCGGRSGGLAAVPLTYRESAYGVLNVYTDSATVFDRHEVTVLKALGRVIGTALHATESRRVLADDNVVELEFALRDPESFFVALSRRADARLEYAGAVAQSDDRVLTFFTVDPPSADIGAAAADLESVDEVTLITEHEGAALYEFALSDDPIVEALAEYGAETHTIVAEDGEGRLKVEVPNETNARSIADLLQERYEGTELVGYNERERPPTTKQEFIAALEDRLTERQLTALRKAYVSGFFEWKRQISGEELATSMDISRATFHQHLRAAERKLVEEFFTR